MSRTKLPRSNRRVGAMQNFTAVVLDNVVRWKQAGGRVEASAVNSGFGLLAGTRRGGEEKGSSGGGMEEEDSGFSRCWIRTRGSCCVAWKVEVAPGHGMPSTALHPGAGKKTALPLVGWAGFGCRWAKWAEGK